MPDGTKLVLGVIESAIHALLHAREVYPSDCFERKRAFNVPVMISRSPPLCKYIGDAMESLVPLVSAVLLHICHSDNQDAGCCKGVVACNVG